MKKLNRFKRKEKGFTLIELLIVVAILGVLAAVVIPNVVGLMGRGGNQAYETDAEVIQLATSTFYSDSHAGVFNDSTDANGGGADAVYWGCNDTSLGNPDDHLEAGHYYPTALAYVGSHTLQLSSTEFDPAPGRASNFRINVDTAGNPADAGDIYDHAIWMGLLVNDAATTCASGDCEGLGGDVPGDATLSDANAASRAEVAPLYRETALYLQDMPESAARANGQAVNPGGYTWIVGKNGTVYGAYEALDSGATLRWYAGFNGGYP